MTPEHIQQRIDTELALGDNPPYVAPGRDYCNDLNAMHALEMSLSESERSEFRSTLCIVTMMKSGPVHATAIQRAEAFLRIREMWDSD